MQSGRTKSSGSKGAEPAANRWQGIIAGFTGAMISLHLILRFVVASSGEAFGFRLDELPLIAALIGGGSPLVIGLGIQMLRREFSSDLLAGLSIVTSVLL